MNEYQVANVITRIYEISKTVFVVIFMLYIMSVAHSIKKACDKYVSEEAIDISESFNWNREIPRDLVEAYKTEGWYVKEVSEE